MSENFKDKILLITGGTGSFGNSVTKKFLCNDEIKEIRIFSRDEKKQDDMRKLYKNDKLKFYIGDVRDVQSVENAMCGVDYIFHASALKQVPSCEFFPLEAVKTNILGTENVLSSAIRHSVKKVICLSTDKAAYPINAMGISKAMMEKVVTAKARTINPEETILCCTRYGNVMASRGSVIPLFIEQIKMGLDITVTDPKMTRFLMSLEEAVNLVLFAFHNAQQGDIFIQKAPACTMLDLAEALKEIFDVPNKISIIGARHGEKLYETLVTKEEMTRSVEVDSHFEIGMDNRNLNYEQYLTLGNKNTLLAMEYTSCNTTMLSVPQIKEKLLQLDFIQNELSAWRNIK
ncbi:MAG: NAD-dependent epimerase/dehydratase family protein [Clostridia bacterium]|nr:NAD-dependent epimerase/dehydratase family protein [Clostridia bacterium]